MLARRLPPRRFSRRVALLLLAFSAGCSGFSANPLAWFKQPSQGAPSAAPQSTAAAPAATQPAPAAVADAPSAEDLAAKVADYTRDVEPRIKSPTKQAGASPATQPAAVVLGNLDWLKPEAVHLSTYQQEAGAPVDSAPPAAPAPISATPDANLPAAAGDGEAVPAAASMAPVGSTIERRLAQRVRDYPKDLDGQLDFQLLLFIQGQPVPQPSSLSGLRSEDRELLSAVMDGLTNFRAAVRSDDNLQLSSKTRPLLDMADRLRTQSELNLPTVALCSEVDSFGVYKPIDSSRFIAGRSNEVIVYCEVQNFQSRLTSDSQWQTQLTEEMVLYTDSGLPIWPAKSNPQPVTDLCRQLRHDFFIAKRVTLPQNLTIGRYVLKMTVTDLTANRVAETTTPVEIVAE